MLPEAFLFTSWLSLGDGLGREGKCLIAMKDDVKANGYSDGAKIRDWALDSVEALSNAGILNGRADGTFDPQSFTTRAEAATVLSNLCDV